MSEVIVLDTHVFHLVPTLRVGMQSWPLQRPECLRDAGASPLAPTPERGSQMSVVAEPTAEKA